MATDQRCNYRQRETERERETERQGATPDEVLKPEASWPTQHQVHDRGHVAVTDAQRPVLQANKACY